VQVPRFRALETDQHVAGRQEQMSAFRTGDSTGLVFTKVLDQLNLGLVDEDEV
jgi:hypothetical protein